MRKLIEEIERKSSEKVEGESKERKKYTRVRKWREKLD